MKKIILFLLLFICIDKVHAEYYPRYTYSEFSPNYPVGYDSRFVDSEDRYLWYREITDPETAEVTREETTAYYKELDGYIRIEESKKTFYRYITSPFVYINGNGEIVGDTEFCKKEICYVLWIKRNEEEEEIINPQTFDNIYLYIGLVLTSVVSFIAIKKSF